MFKKRITKSVLAASFLLLAVGCTNQNTSEEQNSNNTVDTSTTGNSNAADSNYDSNYINNIEVKAFFDFAQKYKDLSSVEFIDKIKELDSNNTLSIERGEYDDPTVPHAMLYTVKTKDSSTTLRVEVTESDEDLEENYSVNYLTLMFNNENVSITYNTYFDSYSVTIEDEQPIITKDTLNLYVENPNDLDEKYLILQEKFKETKTTSVEELENILDHKFTDDSFSSGEVDLPRGTANLTSAHIGIDRFSLGVELVDSSEVYTFTRYADDIIYGYEVADANLKGDEVVKGDKYWFHKDLNSKDEVISYLKSILK